MNRIYYQGLFFWPIPQSSHRGSTTIVTKAWLLVAKKQPDSALRFFFARTVFNRVLPYRTKISDFFLLGLFGIT